MTATKHRPGLTALVLGYCLGRGTLALRGKRSQPWLEVVRPETERTYLDHQLRSLRAACQGAPHRSSLDALPTEGFYDDQRLRFHSPGLWQAYELLYAGDQRQLTSAVLESLGLPALTALLLDRGVRLSPRCYDLKLRTPQEAKLVHEWAASLGVPPLVTGRRPNTRVLAWRDRGLDALIEQVRPWTHRSMRHRLHPPQHLR